MQLPVFKLEALFEEFEFAEDMIALGSSDAQTLTVGELLSLSNESLNLHDIPLSYQDVKGDESLRAAVAEMYAPANVTADNVLITNGATEAILISMLALLDPDDVALVCNPVFQSVREIPKLAGARVKFYNYVEADGFRPDLNTIRAALAAPTPPKLLFINTPHNPTGRVFAPADLAALVADAQQAQVAVVVNEMYSGIWLNDAKRSPSALESGAIVIAGLSKVFGLGGLRLGWLVGPVQFMQKCKEWRYYTSLAPPALLQKLGEIAVRNSAQMLERTTRIVKQNHQTVVAWLREHENDFDWIDPDAGQLMLLRMKRDVDTDRFARSLAAEASVLLIPCTSCFGMPRGYLRLGLGGEPSKFAEGLNRVDRFLRKSV